MINEVYSSTEMIAVIELYEQLQDDLIELICSSIARRGYISDSDEWRLAVLRDSGVVYRDAVSVIAQRTGKSKKLIKELFQHAGIETTTFDNGIYELAGLSPTPIQLSPDLTQILEAGMAKTNASLANLTGTTAVSLQQEYIRACNAAYMQVQSGGVSYTQAIANEIRHAAQYGTTVLYPSGHIDQLDVAVRRATLTGVTQTCGKVSMRNAELMGCDLMEITAHAGARPSHAKWQGKIVSLSGRKGYLSLDDIGYGTGDGFQGWNCRHNWFPFFEGIDTRAYTAAYLEKLQKDSLYELQEKQREYERRIRATKRELAGLDAAMKANPALAAQLQDQFARKSVILKRREAALEDFTKQHNLLRDRSREQAYYGKGTTQGFGRSTSQKAV